MQGRRNWRLDKTGLTADDVGADECFCRLFLGFSMGGKAGHAGCMLVMASGPEEREGSAEKTADYGSADRDDRSGRTLLTMKYPRGMKRSDCGGVA